MNKEVKRIEKIDTVKLFGTELNVYGTFDEPYFLAKEVADWIEYNTFSDKEKTKRNLTQMLRNIKNKHKKKFLVACGFSELKTTYGNKTRARNYQEMLFITEFGLYNLLCISKTRKAEMFKDEIFDIIQEMRKENRELVFSENSKKKNKEIKMKQKIVEYNKLFYNLYTASKYFSNKEMSYFNIIKEYYELDDLNIILNANLRISEILKLLINMGILDEELKIIGTISRDVPILIYYQDVFMKAPLLKFTLPGMLYVKTKLDMINNGLDKDDEKFIIGEIGYKKYMGIKEKKSKKNKKKDENNKKKDKKNIKAVDYIDNLEEKENEKPKDGIRHVGVSRIK